MFSLVHLYIYKSSLSLFASVLDEKEHDLTEYTDVQRDKDDKLHVFQSHKKIKETTSSISSHHPMKSILTELQEKIKEESLVEAVVHSLNENNSDSGDDCEDEKKEMHKDTHGEFGSMLFELSNVLKNRGKGHSLHESS